MKPAVDQWELSGPRGTVRSRGNARQLSPVMLAVSLLFHAVLFTLFFFIQFFSPPLTPPPSVVQVDLISLENTASLSSPPLPSPEVDTAVSSPETPASDAVATEVSPPPPASESSELPPAPADTAPEVATELPVKIPLVKKKVAIKKQKKQERLPEEPPRSRQENAPLEPPREKRALKKKTYQKEKALAHAREQKAADLAKRNAAQLDSALAKIRKEVAVQQRGRKSRFLSSSPGGGAEANRNVQPIDLYNLELMYRIQQNWAFNRRLAGGNDNIEVRILIKILKSGQIRDIWFETRSGNRLLDESALKAIRKSNPLSPLPRGYNAYDVGLIFTPSGLM